eukprot:CCRYP_014779-RA/>CCRYP_014779-RA protein AED:0.27 eAED:0.17 QI:0/-1/0/1/-1/1/1/0/370
MHLFSSPFPNHDCAANRRYPPSRHVVDDNGHKWRLCAGAAVFNSKNEILVGERIGKKGSWQAPQGGVDASIGKNGKLETVTEAAIRELYEEVGLETGKHVLLEKADPNAAPMKSRYKTEGTGSWLKRGGFSGQELNWIIFRCVDSNLECDPSLICTLSGSNGESAEFNSVRWMSLDWVVENVWAGKRGPYEKLRDFHSQVTENWETRCAEIDFNGKWSRESNRSVGLFEALMARGISEEKAITSATEPYVQIWQRLDDSRKLEFKVTTFDKDTESIRRELIYPLGKFTEAYEGNSMLFGGVDGGLIHRECFYLAEPDADEEIAHVTISVTPRGREESRRYLKNGELILRRSFWHTWRMEEVVSTEVFVRC